MRHNNILLICIVCFIQIQIAKAQTDSSSVKDVKDSVVSNDNWFDSFMDPVTYRHYDSLYGWVVDSIVEKDAGRTTYYHLVNGKNIKKYTFYHKSGIIVLSDVRTKNDTIAIFDWVKIINGDTIEQSDTIPLYYPDLLTLNYPCNNITLDAFKEKRFSQMDTTENIVRIFRVDYEKGLFFAVAYIISNITRDSLRITKKTGEHLCQSLRTSSLDRITNYTYEEFSHKISSNKKIRKILQEMTTLEYLPRDNSFDYLIVEYRISGKYYLLTFPYEHLTIYADFSPEMKRTYKVIKKLITYLENSFQASKKTNKSSTNPQ